MSQGRSARRDPTVTTASSRLRYLLGCCFQSPYDRDIDAMPFVTDRYDFVVEKLLVRRVPLALYAIPRDLNEGTTTSPDKEEEPDLSSQNSAPKNSAIKAVSYTNSTDATKPNKRSEPIRDGYPKYLVCARTKEEELLENLLKLTRESAQLSKNSQDAAAKSKFVVAPVAIEHDRLESFAKDTAIVRRKFIIAPVNEQSMPIFRKHADRKTLEESASDPILRWKITVRPRRCTNVC